MKIGIAQRRFLSLKVSTRRWKFFHGRKTSIHDILPNIKNPPIGFYKKRKGCECRFCSHVKQIRKHQTNKKLRVKSVD